MATKWSLLCLKLCILLNRKGPTVSILHSRIVYRVLHRVIEIWAYPSLVSFNKIVRVSCSLFWHQLLDRLIFPIILVFCDVMLIHFCSFVLIHQVVWWPLILTNRSWSFLNLGIYLALWLRFFLVTVITICSSISLALFRNSRFRLLLFLWFFWFELFLLFFLFFWFWLWIVGTRRCFPYLSSSFL